MDKIDGSSALPLNSLLGQGQAQSADKKATQDSSVGHGGETHSTPSAKDRLTIDNTTQVLRDAEATLDSEAPVDNQKVAQIRQAIADGNYKIDAGRIADSFLALEKSLFQK